MLKFACILVALSLAAASDVLDLTDSTFADSLAEQDVALVEFFAPWCGHCKRLAPEFEKAATTLKENDPPVALAKVDCTAETGICGKHGVSGYPTLKIFRNGEFSEDYQGPREEDGIVKFMKGKAGPSSKEIKSVDEAKAFLGKPDIGVFGFFAKDSSDGAKEFQKLASALSDNFRFAHTYSKDVLDQYKFSDNIVILQPKKFHNKFEPKELKYDGELSSSKLKTWVNDNVHGLAGHRTTGNADQFKQPQVVAYYAVDYVKNVKGTNYWRNRVMKVAKKFKDAGKDLTFAVASKDDFAHELSEFGITNPGDKPSVAALNKKGQKFVMSDEFSMDALEKFVQNFLDDKLEPYLKSEAIPESDDGFVKTIVGKNFDAIVNDENKDVLIEFYAPWCGHCKSLAPKFEELAEKLKDEKEIVIAKMDATANDVPKNYEVKGFPTIYYAPKGSKSIPKSYEGGREVDDFIAYLARESTNPLSGFTRGGKEKKSEL